MAEKMFNTRFKLRYDTAANWDKIATTFIPLAGEVCIYEVKAALTDNKGVVVEPPVTLIKVGDGATAVGALNYLYGKAADVYPWAKLPNLPLSAGTYIEVEKQDDVWVVTHAATITDKTSDTGTAKFGDTITVIDNVEVDAEGRGHVTKINTKTITLPTPEEVSLPTVEDTAVDFQFVTEVDQTAGAIAVQRKELKAGNNIDIAKDNDGNVTVAFANNKVTTAETADKVANDLTIKVGGAEVVYNGSEAKTADVDTAITNAVNSVKSELEAEMSTAMVFKGSLGINGTITDLPAATAETEGDTYKVITAGAYGTDATLAEVGDVFICANKGDNTYEWVLIPSGDIPNGTVTSITAGTDLVAEDTNPITSSGTISHAEITRTDGTDTAETPAHGDEITVVSSIATSATGHVTGVNTKKITLPENKDTTYTFEQITGDDTYVATYVLKDNEGNEQGSRIQFNGSSSIDVELNGTVIVPQIRVAVDGGLTADIDAGLKIDDTMIFVFDGGSATIRTGESSTGADPV